MDIQFVQDDGPTIRCIKDGKEIAFANDMYDSPSGWELIESSSDEHDDFIKCRIIADCYEFCSRI